jgi:DNA primase
MDKSLPVRRHSTNFQRDRLPSSTTYYKAEGIKLVGGGEWRSALCPFHADKKPSLRVRLETGAFRCMACGVKGFDVLAFHRLRHGMTFVEAARDLGAWGV